RSNGEGRSFPLDRFGTLGFVRGRHLMVTLMVNGERREGGGPGGVPVLLGVGGGLGLPRPQVGGGRRPCGGFALDLHDKPVRSCVLPVGNVGSRRITTIEAIGKTPTGAKVQKAWLDLEVIQCGYCQSGQIMSATALLNATPNPDDADIDAAMAGNICRCGTYVRIRQAIKQAATERTPS